MCCIQYVLTTVSVGYVMVNIEAKFDAEVGLRVGVDFLCLHGFSFSTVF